MFQPIHNFIERLIFIFMTLLHTHDNITIHLDESSI